MDLIIVVSPSDYAPFRLLIGAGLREKEGT